MKAPEVFYARSGDVSIAYQVVGDGPVDLVFVRGLAGELLSTWEQPHLVAGSGVGFEDRGEHELRGIPGAWRVFAVAGG